MFPQGQIYADYQLLSSAFTGNFGEVYKALHIPTNKIVALKFTKHPHDQHWFKRFEAENKYLHDLSPHDNVIKAFSGVTHDGTHAYYTMEYLEQGLEAYLGTNPDTAKRLEVFKQICEGLKHAHSKEIYHRDLHAGNVRMDAETAKLVDFGLGKDGQTLSNSIGQLVWLGGVTTPEAFFYVADSPTNEEYAQRDTYALGIILYTIFAASTVPYTVAMQNSMITHIVGLNPNFRDYFNDYLNAFDETNRRAQYRAWLAGLDPTMIDKLTVSVADVNLGKKLSVIIKKACSADYTQRYATVDDVIQATEGL
jgi:serine/threonine protein kinase